MIFSTWGSISRSIFVGALKENITEQDLVNYFSGFGKVLRANKILDRETGEKKTYGFVDFAEFGIVKKIMNVTKHYIQVKCQIVATQS